MTERVTIPLFPLGLVLLPDMRLPLHIFEERYKRMISECLAEDRPFGIVLFDGPSIRSVGCMARITEVMKRYDDGRMDIMTRGGERFVIQELIEDQDYMEARVFVFDDSENDIRRQIWRMSLTPPGICSKRWPTSIRGSIRPRLEITFRRNGFPSPSLPWKDLHTMNDRVFWR